MELILVRHGLPEASAVTDDPPLAVTGLDQARRAARALARERIDAVYSSPMRRAVQTAEPFAAQGEHAIQTHVGVVEFDRSSGDYTPLEELKRNDYAAWQAFVASGRDPDIAAFQLVVVTAMEEIIA